MIASTIVWILCAAPDGTGLDPKPSSDLAARVVAAQRDQEQCIRHAATRWRYRFYGSAGVADAEGERGELLADNTIRAVRDAGAIRLYSSPTGLVEQAESEGRRWPDDVGASCVAEGRAGIWVYYYSDEEKAVVAPAALSDTSQMAFGLFNGWTMASFAGRGGILGILEANPIESAIEHGNEVVLTCPLNDAGSTVCTLRFNRLDLRELNSVRLEGMNLAAADERQLLYAIEATLSDWRDAGAGRIPWRATHVITQADNPSIGRKAGAMQVELTRQEWTAVPSDCIELADPLALPAGTSVADTASHLVYRVGESTVKMDGEFRDVDDVNSPYAMRQPTLTTQPIAGNASLAPAIEASRYLIGALIGAVLMGGAGVLFRKADRPA